jgi:hypothetical protein
MSLAALAQAGPAVIDGDMWVSSSPEVRKAFLAGASSMITLESVYSKKKARCHRRRRHGECGA